MNELRYAKFFQCVGICTNNFRIKCDNRIRGKENSYPGSSHDDCRDKVSETLQLRHDTPTVLLTSDNCTLHFLYIYV